MSFLIFHTYMIKIFKQNCQTSQWLEVVQLVSVATAANTHEHLYTSQHSSPVLVSQGRHQLIVNYFPFLKHSIHLNGQSAALRRRTS